MVNKENLYILHTASRGVVGKSIRWFTGKKGGSTASHSLLVYYSIDMRCWATLEALFDGVFPRPIQSRPEIADTAVSVHRVIIPYQSARVILSELLRETAGANYDFALTIGWMFPSVANKILRRDAYVPLLNSKSRFNCSELLASRFHSRGVAGFRSDMNPAQFATALDFCSAIERMPKDDTIRSFFEDPQ